MLKQTHAWPAEMLLGRNTFTVYIYTEITKKKIETINSPGHNSEAVRKMSIHISVWRRCCGGGEPPSPPPRPPSPPFSHERTHFRLHMDGHTHTFWEARNVARLLASTHQDDFLDVLGRAPVKHPCRVIPLHVHVHVLDLLVTRDEKGVVSTEKTQQCTYGEESFSWHFTQYCW